MTRSAPPTAAGRRYRVAVVPAGTWGTALALVLADNGHEVRLWHRDAGVVAGINRERVNPRHLTEVRLPENVTATTSLAAAVVDADMVVLVPASAAFRELAAQSAPLLTPHQLLLSATKGLEPDTHRRMSQLLAAYVPDVAERTAVLSGPNFAVEVARRLPTSTVIAAERRQVAELFQTLFFNPNFRVYINPDVIGVELAGSLKNVLAIGVGMAHGYGLGFNTAAAIITRGIAEITRLGLALGAHPLTFAGLAGLGDIVLTCTSDLSRNRRAGVLLGQGKRLVEILEQRSMTVEGVRTAKAAFELAQRLDCEVPIIEQIYRVLYEGKPIAAAVRCLMERTQKPEIEAAFLDGLQEIDFQQW